MKSQLEHFSNRNSLLQFLNNRAYSIAVASGKGGVGKSSICVNLARAFVKRGQRVLLVDGDPGMADLHILLGKTPERNWGHFLRGEYGIGEIVQPNVHGIDFIHGFTGMEDSSLGTKEAMERLLVALSALAKNYDLVLIDVGAGVHESSLFLTTAVKETLLVLNPDFTSLADAYGALKTMCKWNPDQYVSVGINRVQTENQGVETYKNFIQVTERFLSRRPDLRGVLPEASEVGKSLFKQEPVIDCFPNCKWTQDLVKWVDEIEKDRMETES